MNTGLEDHGNSSWILVYHSPGVATFWILCSGTSWCLFLVILTLGQQRPGSDRGCPSFMCSLCRPRGSVELSVFPEVYNTGLATPDIETKSLLFQNSESRPWVTVI